ncbi:MAG: site-2 protease family protein [Rhodoglobus sp.]
MTDEPRYGERIEPSAPRPVEPIGSRPVPPRSRGRYRGPSPVFLGILAVAIASGWALWAGFGPAGIVAFLFVTSTWVVSLCLHEFAHALVAYRSGDESVAYRGYLDLNPLRYTHVMYSIVLPLLFVILGGIGLPGGAVFINRGALRTRFSRSAVSAAGPLTNAVVAVLLAIAFAFREGSSPFWVAVAFLMLLQVTAALLNLLPVPGLDGFGIIEPYLSRETVAGAMRVAPYTVIGLFALLWIPQLNQAFFGLIYGILSLLHVPAILVGSGYALFQFWR